MSRENDTTRSDPDLSSPEESKSNVPMIDRRKLLRGIAVAGGFAAGGPQLFAQEADAYDGEYDDVYELQDRLEEAIASRQETIQQLLVNLTTIESDYDSTYFDLTKKMHGIEMYPSLFMKGMSMETNSNDDPYPEGFVSVGAHEAVMSPILRNRDEYNNIPQGDERRFISPQSVHSFPTEGMDSWSGTMPPAPSPGSDHMAGEMVDLYWMAALRDQPFDAYSGTLDGAITKSDINADITTIADAIQTPWWHNTGYLFVEAATDELDYGPYLSQFLIQDVMFGAFPISPEIKTFQQGQDYRTTRQEWLRLLAGEGQGAESSPPASRLTEGPRYIATGRDLAALVNFDPSYHVYVMAALTLLDQGISMNPALQYMTDAGNKIFDYIDGGPVALLDLIGRAARNALLTAWYHKWRVHLRLRPETFAGRIHSQRIDSRYYGISDLVFESNALTEIEENTGTAFLPLAYKEGAPVHPAYPSGHSTIAGACGTVLKTFFKNEDWPGELFVPVDHGASRTTVPVPANHQGVHQEIDKLMSNMGLGRLFAGVHYYSDHYWGIKLGEQTAVAMLRDVLDQAYTDGRDVTPTFTEYFGDYSNPLEISIEELENLRESATHGLTYPKS
ncbi:vanadium-dependent haloperoxidase [Halocatena halophila]|uniref:vanadium-dependent haloperoxidase n=1 Tax=Halocatena halophila TaxID=2814576 RepID=UPI002ED1CCB6